MPMTTEQMERAYVDPSTGSIKRRHLKRLLNGIKSIGPTLLRPEPPAPSKADIAAPHQHAATHAKTVDAELKAIDARVAEIDKLLRRGVAPSAPTFGPVAFANGQRFGGAVGGAGYQSQEMAGERRQLLRLRVEIENERDKPITVDREGRALTERDYALLAARARDTAESHRRHAERCAAQGEHREARRHRVDSTRARHIAEFERHLRKVLPGYSSQWA